MTERVKMAGPFPICIKTEDGKRFNGEYFTIGPPCWWEHGHSEGPRREGAR